MGVDVPAREDGVHGNLAAGEEAFRLMVEGVRDYAIFTLDPEGYVSTWNVGAERIKGYTADQIVGQHFSRFYTPEDISTGKPQRELHVARETGTYEEEGLRVRRDRSRFWASVLITALFDPAGRLRGFAKLTRDVTERKKAEQALVAAKEQAEHAAREAERANRAKDHFLGVLSHELRTPLTPVLATVTFVERRPDLPDELRGEIGAIRRNIELEARLVDDLLDMTRISRGKIELHHEAVDVHGLVRTAVQMVQADVEGKGLDLTLGLRAKHCHAWADPTRIQQVLSNVLQNAVKFTPEGGSVAVRTANEAGQLRVEVADTGVGVDPDLLPRLFDPFEQGERMVTGGLGGLGLGLSIAKAFVDLHGGTLTAASGGQGKGATFTLTLSTIPEVAERERSAITPGPQQPDRTGCTILLVEDHDDTRRVMARPLRTFRYDVKTAATVAEALQLTDRERIDLLISDIGLPDGTGHEVMRHASQRGIRGIALSGFGQDDDIRRSREAGFEMHLVKPVNFQSLESVVRRAAPLP